MLENTPNILVLFPKEGSYGFLNTLNSFSKILKKIKKNNLSSQQIGREFQVKFPTFWNENFVLSEYFFLE